MIRCEFSSMRVQSLLDHLVAGATLQQPKPYYTTMPPRWANARGGHAIRPWVGLVGHAAAPI